MMEDHLPKIPMMASASPTESSGSSGTDDSRGGKKLHQEQQDSPIRLYNGAQTWPAVRKKSETEITSFRRI